jgi:hypothetical protein
VAGCRLQPKPKGADSVVEVLGSSTYIVKRSSRRIIAPVGVEPPPHSKEFIVLPRR